MRDLQEFANSLFMNIADPQYDLDDVDLGPLTMDEERVVDLARRTRQELRTIMGGTR